MAWLSSLLGGGTAATTGGLTALGTGAAEAALPTLGGAATGIGSGLGSGSAIGGLASTPALPTLAQAGTSGGLMGTLGNALKMKNEVMQNPYVQVARMLNRGGGSQPMTSGGSTMGTQVPRRRVRMF
jgi:hypothetical protein